MSTSIDERIVDMQFNNRQFEDGVSDSLKSLENLKKGLELDGASKGLDELSKNASKFSLAGLSEGVDKIADKFTAMSIIAITALQNIVNRAVDAGIDIVKSLTLTPIIDGFREYELQMNAVKVMMANLGDKASMAQINEALGALNTYADKTIYNFGEMTDAVGKFTAAGVGLDDSTTSIKGLSNVAAGAGVPAYKMANAYIQVSQALQAGTFRLQDWNSMQNAGLANQEFRNRLLANAEAINGFTLGAENFRDSLKKGWLTTEVFLATMKEAADETNDWGKRLYAAATEVTTFTQMVGTLKEAIGTGWGDSLKIVIGDFEEAKELWTDVSGVLDKMASSSANARNEMLSFWKGAGGRDALIEALSNAGKGLIQVMEVIAKAWDSVFPPMTGANLVALTQGFLKLSERFTLSSETADKLQRTFAGLFAIVGLIIDIFSGLFGVLGKVVGALSPIGGGFLDVTASIGDFLVALREGKSVTEFFEKAITKVGEILEWITDKIELSVGKIREYFGQFSGFDLGPLRVFSGEIETQFRPFTFVAEVFQGAINLMVQAWQSAQPYFQAIGNFFGPILTAIGDKIKEFASAAGINSVADLFNPAMLGILVLGIKQFLDTLSEVIGGAKGFTEGVVSILDGVRGALEAYQTKLKSQALLNIAIAVGVLAASLYVISTIPVGDMAAALGGITVLITELAAVMLVLSKNMGSTKLTFVAIQMMLIATSILILSAAMKSLADLSWEELAKGGTAIAALSAILVLTADMLGKSSAKMIGGSIGLIAMATAILILTQSVKQLSELSWEQLATGLIGVGVLLTELALFSKLVDTKGMLSVGLAMIPLATGILILTQAVKQLSEMSWEELAKGLAGLGIALAEIALTSKVMDPVALLAMGVSMIGVGAGIAAIAGALLIIGSLSWEDLAKGLAGIFATLAAIAITSKVMDPVSLVAMGVALVGVGVALTIIAGAMKIFGSMSWEELAKGLTALAASLMILAITAKVIGVSGLAGAAAILIMAAALAIMVPSLVILGMMDMENIGHALLMLVGVFTIFGVAGLVLAPVAPVMLALGAAMALLGAGVALLGVGLLALSASMITFAAAGAVGTAALVYTAESLIGLIPTVIQKVGEGLILLLVVIVDSIPLIMEAVTLIVLGLIEVLVKLAPDLVVAIFVFLDKMLNTMVDYIPKLVDAGMQLLIGILYGIEKNMADIVFVALKIIAEFLVGIARGIPDIISSAVDVIVAFLTAIGKETPRIIDAGFKMIIDFVNGLADAIRDNTGPLVESFHNLAGAMIEGLVDGLFAGFKGAVDTIKNLGNALIDGFKDVLGIHSPSKVMEKEAENIPAGAVKGVNNGISDAKDVGANLGQAILTGFKQTNSSKTFKEFGIQNVKDYISGLTSMGEAIKASLTMVFSSEEDAETLKAMTTTVDEALKTIENRITSYTDLATDRLSSLTAESEITVAEMISNLKNNQQIISDWAKNIAILAERGLSEGLLEELRQAGPKSAGEVKNMVAASDTELQQLNVAFGKGGEIATKALITSVGEAAPLLVEPGQNIVEALANGLSGSTSLNDAMSLLIGSAKTVGANNTTEFAAIGKTYASEFSKALEAQQEVAKAAATKVSSSAATGIKSNEKDYGTTGTKAGTDFSGGLTDTKTPAVVAGSTVTNSAETGLKSNETEYGKIGIKGGSDFAGGISNTKPEAKIAGEEIAKEAATGVASNVEEFETAGVYAGEGFIKGMESMLKKAADAGAKIGRAAKRGVDDELDIDSPSKELYATGEFGGLGFIGGLLSMVNKVGNAGREIGSEAISGVKSAISKISDVVDGDINLSPVITPVLDLTNLQNGSRSISQMLSGSQVIRPIAKRVEQISLQTDKNNEPAPLNNIEPVNKIPVSFVQNNYSPKALTRLEIYRQTKNQFAQLKGLVEGV